MTERIYGDGTNSSIGSEQFNDFYYKRKALVELKNKQYFMPLASVTGMPKHMGKRIKLYHYLPLLDDANINDQGIDASGNRTLKKATIRFLPPDVTAAANGENVVHVVAEGPDDATALTNVKAENRVVSAFEEAGFELTWDTNYNTTKTALIADGWKVSDDSTDTIPGMTYQAPVFYGGNLYGSNRDVGTITSKLPALSERGGRVNRVGFTRKEVTGSIDKFGFFDEYTAESLNFDTDPELEMHVHREMLKGANEITEMALQIDLLNNAGIIKYGGTATSTATLTGENGATASVPTFDDFMKISIDLDKNRTPESTTIIDGSRMQDTRTVPAARYMYIGTEMITTIRKMKDVDDTSKKGSGFIPVEKYANAGKIMPGEIGQVDRFKIIVVPDMAHWDGAGATATNNDGYITGNNGRYNVYPLLVVGDQSFTTIGFQTDGKTFKFKIKHVKPETTQAYNTSNPFGEIGFMSIKWYYGTLILRPERIALIKSVAPY